MKEIIGKHNSALIMADEIEQTTEEQIQRFLDCDAFTGSTIRIMADTHAGKGSVIGFTGTMTDKIVPNVVGVDIGCGIEAYKIGDLPIDFANLDQFIRNEIPSGFSVNKTQSKLLGQYDSIHAAFGNTEYCNTGHFLAEVKEMGKIIAQNDEEAIEKFLLALGSLGGGNHFIEIDTDEQGNKWLLLHTGSRNFGKRVCDHYQLMAKLYLKNEGIEGDYRDMEFLPLDKGGNEYLESMRVAQKYAVFNRHIIASRILGDYFGLNVVDVDKIKTVHNYINFEDNIIRKGSISAHDGEKVLIPINMRDGVIVGKGKGSIKWNQSAPHGAGRLLGRNEAKRRYKVEEFVESMKGIWTSCVSEKTLDEAPFVYKDMQFILDNIGETVDVDFILKPNYNFKAQ